MNLIPDMEKLCKDCSVEFIEPDWSLKVGISADLFDDLSPINGLRHPEESGTMGWYLYAGQEFPKGDDAFSPLHARHIAERKPFWLKYLALPAGWRFLVDRSGYKDVWYDEQLLEATK